MQDVQSFGRSCEPFDDGSNMLQVQIPAALGYVVGVADAIPNWGPDAQLAILSHSNTLLLP